MIDSICYVRGSILSHHTPLVRS